MLEKKYNRSTLFRMKQFYNVFDDEKAASLVRQLTWSHCLILLPLNLNKVIYYIDQIYNRNLSKRQLETIVKSREYERLPDETRDKLINKSEIKIEDYIKSSIIIKNNKKYNKFSEKVLQQLILDDIPSFLKLLGFRFYIY